MANTPSILLVDKFPTMHRMESSPKCLFLRSHINILSPGGAMARDETRSPSPPRTTQPRRRPLNTRACDRCRRRKAKVRLARLQDICYLLLSTTAMSNDLRWRYSATRGALGTAALCAGKLESHAPLTYPWRDVDQRPGSGVKASRLGVHQIVPPVVIRTKTEHHRWCTQQAKQAVLHQGWAMLGMRQEAHR